MTEPSHASVAWFLGMPVVGSEADDDRSESGAVTAYRAGDLLVLEEGWPRGERRTLEVLDVVPAPGADSADVASVDRGGVVRATAVRVGPVMVDLDSHVALRYGIEAGLLRTQEGGTVGFEISPDSPDVTGIDTTIEPAPADGADGAQRVLYGWYLGMPLVHHVTLPEFYGGPLPAEPDPSLPVMRTYLTAPVDASAPSSPVRQVPTAEGPRVMLSHQNTTDAHPGAEPASAFGYFVVAGPKATDDDVLVGESAENSIPEQPLAAQIRLDGHWVKLNSHLVIEHGVQLGLLALVPLEYGGQMRTALPDDLQLRITATGAVRPDTPELTRQTVGTFDIKTHDLELTGNRENSAVAYGARRVEISAGDLSFSPDRITARPGEDLEIVLHADDVMHNWELVGSDGYVVADAGQTAYGGVRVPQEPGEYTFACTLMAHRAAGMTGTLVVK